MLPSTKNIQVGSRVYRVYETTSKTKPSQKSTEPLKLSPQDGKYTHFLSFPLSFGNVEELTKNFSPIHKALTDIRGYDKSWTIKVSQYHVTLLMLSLPTEEHVEKAREVLQYCSSLIYDALGSTALRYKLQGVNTFQPDSTKTRVLFADILEATIPGTTGASIALNQASIASDQGQRCSRTMRVVHILAKALSKAGLLPESEIKSQNIFHSKTDLKKSPINFDSGISGIHWHCTIAKVRHKNKQNSSFDTSEIINNFGSTDFGIYRVPCLQLNRLSPPTDNTVSVEPSSALDKYRNLELKNQDPTQKDYYYVDIETPMP